MYSSRLIQWYHSHVDSIWPDGSFKWTVKDSNYTANSKLNATMMLHFDLCTYF